MHICMHVGAFEKHSVSKLHGAVCVHQLTLPNKANLCFTWLRLALSAAAVLSTVCGAVWSQGLVW